MFEFNLWGLLSALSIAIYQYALFHYASNVLDKGRKSLLANVIFALINTFAIVTLDTPYWFLYVMATAILVVEFKVISKASFRQTFAGATMFTIHVSSLHFLVIAMYTDFNDLMPSEILTSNFYRQRITFITFTILLLMLLVVGLLIPKRDIKRVTTAKLYSEMLGGVAFLFVVYFSIGIYIYFIYESFEYRLQFVIINTIIMLMIMYFILLYVIRFVNMHEYKRYADELGETYSIIQNQKEILSAKVERDDLTGLYNRKYINQMLDNIFVAESDGFGLMYIDVNRLKYVNDNFGHHKGDKLILCVAGVLTKVLRDDDVSARVGGDEFLVIVDNVQSKDQLDKISKRIEELVFIHDEIEDYPVSVSIGSVYVSDDIRRLGVGEAVSLADKTMRENKAAYYEKEGRYIK